MKYYVILLSIIFVGCTEKVTTKVSRSTRQECVTKEDRKELADFIIKCSQAANPMSDEEGEDLVEQCERTGINTLCPDTEVCQTVTHTRGWPFNDTDYSGWAPCKADQ